MKQYLDLLRKVYTDGVRQKNRTGIDTFMIPGGMMQFELARGFPILTTKEVNFDAVKAELIGFIQGYDNAGDFRQLGTKIWDKNANENKAWLANPNRRGEDDLGRIYGKQWRSWRAPMDAATGKHLAIDQLATALDMIKLDPTSRRIIVTAWNPAELHKMALPPCHMLYQFMVEQGRGALHMTMYMRSCDMFLGVPFNISSYALLLALVAKATRYEPGTLTVFLADVHIYENHLDQVNQQLMRSPLKLPRLHINPGRIVEEGSLPIHWLDAVHPADVHLEGYDPLPAIKGDMAV